MTVTAFLDERRIAVGSSEDVTQELEERYPLDLSSVMVFDDETGARMDLDFWRPKAEASLVGLHDKAAVEVELLPRHIEWLRNQPRSLSATIRRLVEAAMLEPVDPAQRLNAACRFMQAVCGNLENFEEALRALYRRDAMRLASLISAWPDDYQSHIRMLIRLPSVEMEPAK